MSSLYNYSINQEASGVGFIANIDGSKSHNIVEQSIGALERMAHGAGQNPMHSVADGAGLLVPLPKSFFKKQWPCVNSQVPWAVGQLFLPRNAQLRGKVLDIVRQSLTLCHLNLLDGREVPISIQILQKNARMALPFMAQILVCPTKKTALSIGDDVFERRLFLARRIMEHDVKNFLHTHNHDTRQFYVASLSAHTIVYKGLVRGAQLHEFYEDLHCQNFAASYAIFHQRFSHNRNASWRIAQPLRMLAHSGEIHSLHGMQSYLDMCKPVLSSSLFGKDLSELLPIIYNTDSPAAALDNLCEFFTHCGRSLPHVLMMLFPEHIATNAPHYDLYDAFYKFHAALLPALSGNSCMTFTDGTRWLGAMQDAKSRHACRYCISHDGVFALATEAGALDIETKRLAHKGRLRHGQMIALDMLQKRVLYNAELKGNIIQERKYKHFVSKYLSTLQDIENKSPKHAAKVPKKSVLPLHILQDRFCFSSENFENYLQDVQKVHQARADEQAHAISLFNCCDVSFFNHFKIIVPYFTVPFCKHPNITIKFESFVGRIQNPLEPQPEFCKTLYLDSPFITANDLDVMLQSEKAHICVHTLDASFEHNKNTELGIMLENALLKLRQSTVQALKAGATILIISHKTINDDIHNLRTPIPSLLAVATVHKFLIKNNLRHLCGIIAESADAMTPMHMVQLLNCGADAICPYLALNSASVKNKDASSLYMESLYTGLSNIFSLLNVNSILSLKDGQFFESVGIAKQIIDEHFNNILSRIGGLGFEQIALECYRRNLGGQVKNNKISFAAQNHHSLQLQKLLQHAVTANSTRNFHAYLKHCHASHDPYSLRCLLQLKTNEKHDGLLLEQVEPLADIIRRFVLYPLTKLSPVAEQCLIQAYGSAGCIPYQSRLKPYRLKQYINELYWKRQDFNAQAIIESDELIISLGHECANEEFSTYGQHDIASLNDIKQLIYDLRKVQPNVRITVKLPSQAGIGNIGVGMVKAGAHCLLVCGCADIPIYSPLFTNSNEILPWEMGLTELQHALTANNLRRQVRLRVAGQFFTGKDIIKAILLGAEELAFPTPILLSMGCDLCKTCQKDPCPKGLHIGSEVSVLHEKAKKVERFLSFLANDVRREMALLGFAYVDQMVGRADLLEMNCRHTKHKSASFDLSGLMQASSGALGQRNGTPSYAPLPVSALEAAIMEKLTPFRRNKIITCSYNGTVNISDRSIGTYISGAILRHDKEVLQGKNENTEPKHDVSIKLWGSAGQSLGAFLHKGITLCVYGEANDHVGKSLSGGILSVSHAPNSRLAQGEHALIGNVALYGATSGEAYIGGMAGEYFAICNNGACAVVEGVGDFACQHMQAGTVIILGTCGKHFAKGMYGGTAYLHNPTDAFMQEQNIKGSFVDSDDIRTLRYLLQQHIHFTKSSVATKILNDWENALSKFIAIKA